MEPTGGTADLNGRVNSDSSAQDSGFKPRTLKVKGQEFVVDSEAKAVELMQKGASYERDRESFKEERRKAREEENERLRRLQPLLDVDEMLRNDPAKRAKVNAILQDKEIPAMEEDTDDPYQRQINGLGRQLSRMEQLLQKGLGTVSGSVEDIRRNEQLRGEERELRRKYPKVATDDTLDEAREFAQRHGVDLTTAFRNVTYDTLPELVRQETFEEYGVDPASLSPQRSEVPTLGRSGAAHARGREANLRGSGTLRPVQASTARSTQTEDREDPAAPITENHGRCNHRHYHLRLALRGQASRSTRTNGLRPSRPPHAISASWRISCACSRSRVRRTR
jgi:hypothetical protein